MNELNTRSIQTVTEEINYLTAQAQRLVLGHAIEIGRRLTEAKSMLGHGEWGRWLREEVHYSQSSANNLMRIFDAYGASQMGLFGPEANCQTFGNLEYSKALALLAVPEDERETFAQEVDAEHCSVRELRAAIKAREEAEEAARVASNERDALLLKVDAKSEALRKAKEEAEEQRKKRAEVIRQRDELTAMVQELQNKPTEVAVRQIDASPEQLREAEQRGREAAKEVAVAENKILADQVVELQKKLEESDKSSREALQTASAENQELVARMNELQKQLEKAKSGAPDLRANQALVEINLIFKDIQEKAARVNTLLESLDEVTQARIGQAMKQVFALMRTGSSVN